MNLVKAIGANDVQSFKVLFKEWNIIVVIHGKVILKIKGYKE